MIQDMSIRIKLVKDENYNANVMRVEYFNNLLETLSKQL